MTVDHSSFLNEVHARAQENQPAIKRRINSSVAALFGSGAIATVVVAGLDVLPWWAALAVMAVLAMAEVVVQALSKASLAPSQREKLAEAAQAIEQERNPAPTTTDIHINEMKDSVESLQERFARFVEDQRAERMAAEAANQPDPDEQLRNAY
ncbi:hypothetical protein QPX10_10165 [Corynebacterium pseudodiphtheriticum]|uniref:hypothetical protein n=1 Tax=Corynebacterium pseudodiphtheriticum TaxID=37637 RepID=UPI002542F398|nr:hypothetical protein [Corynebacterium pseudodiphtheriticum]MDK4244031.1 hypothetical protein [Corynebacterium pseudodiphtheriticum]MDK4329178.1 hypothetical protein [Corynebacterium pseudodiphtheriticum]